MELQRFEAVDDFLRIAEPFLVEREAEHNLILGVASSITEAPEAYSGPPYLAVVTDRDRVVAAAVRTAVQLGAQARGRCPPWRRQVSGAVSAVDAPGR